MFAARWFVRTPLLCVAITACVPPQPTVTALVRSERETQKTYTVGRRDSAVVGARALSVKDYVVTRSTMPARRASSTFSLTVRQRMLCGYSAESTFFSRSTRDNPAELVVRVPCNSVPLELITDSLGVPTGEWQVQGGTPTKGGLMFSPPDVRFVPAIREEIDRTAGYTNFELLYGGTDGRSFTLTYREYTPDDMIRASFSQTLTFENSSKSIRFRNLRIQVHSVTSEQFVYTVVSDAS